MRVLLVEDDPALGQAVRGFLVQEAYAVDWAQRLGAARLRALARRRSGRRGEHKSRSCATCHGHGYSSTTVGPATHNNGMKDLAAGSIGWNAMNCSCSNACHGIESW